jgi:hypothetical protein
MLAVRRPATGGTRYEMLETLREYGRSRLDGERSVQLFGAHAHQFAAIARSVETDLGTPQESVAVARADGSFADLRAAQRFAFEIQDFDTAFGLICATREYAMRTMRYEVFAWADASARMDEGAGHPLHPGCAHTGPSCVENSDRRSRSRTRPGSPRRHRVSSRRGWPNGFWPTC